MGIDGSINIDYKSGDYVVHFGSRDTMELFKEEYLVFAIGINDELTRLGINWDGI